MIGVTQDEFERIQLKKGDVLIVEGHGNINEIGRSAIWDGSVPNCVHQNHLIRVRVNEKLINNIYLDRYINSSFGRNFFTESSNTTSGLNTISTGTVKRLPVALPPLPLQQKFAQIVQKYERLRAQQRESERQGEHLFQSLLHRAFGEEV
jgi:type I restriction enzyme S subunit